MRRDEITQDTTEIAFGFFYYFSRFECLLKENRYLDSFTLGVRAKPGWTKFEASWRDCYKMSSDARSLLENPPMIQVVDSEGLTWQVMKVVDGSSDLQAAIDSVRTVRNNLFHGAKHGSEDWDDPDRTAQLIGCSTAVLIELATMASLEADLQRRY